MSWYTDPELYITRLNDGTFRVYRVTKEKWRQVGSLSFSNHLSLGNNKESDYDDFKASLPQSVSYRHCINSRGSLIDWKYTTGQYGSTRVSPGYPFWSLPGIPQLKSVNEQALEGIVSDLEAKQSSLRDALNSNEVEKEAISRRGWYSQEENANLKAQINKENNEKTDLTIAIQSKEVTIAGLEAKVSSLQDEANNNKVEKEALDQKVLNLESENAVQKEQVSIERNEKEVLQKSVLDLEVEAADLKARVIRDRDEKRTLINGLQSTVDKLRAGTEILNQQVKDFKSKIVL